MPKCTCFKGILCIMELALEPTSTPIALLLYYEYSTLLIVAATALVVELYDTVCATLHYSCLYGVVHLVRHYKYP